MTISINKDKIIRLLIGNTVSVVSGQVTLQTNLINIVRDEIEKINNKRIQQLIDIL